MEFLTNAIFTCHNKIEVDIEAIELNLQAVKKHKQEHSKFQI